MATKQTTVDFITEQIADAGDVRSRKMFGEYALYCDEKVVALVCDDQLYIKPTALSARFLDEAHLAPPYPGAKAYYRVPDEKLEDSRWLTDFIRQTAAQLPLPKPKKNQRGHYACTLIAIYKRMISHDAS